MTEHPTYRQFLEGKIKFDVGAGFEVPMERINPALKDFTRASVKWLLEGGRRALFSSFGLHKTATQLEVMRLAPVKVPRLIVMPLGVRQEFFNDAARFFSGDYAIDLRFARTTAEIDDTAPIWLTNYESIREGKLDPRGMCVSLDEASILRGFGGTKTFREFMAAFEGAEGYRFVATATPSPNEYIELLAYAAFLGIMEVSEAKTRFFKRNSEKADKLTLHPHKEREFWLWVASWALFIGKPSDLGFSDEGYTLPKLQVLWHELLSDHATAGEERDGQGRMFRNAATGVQDAAKEKRDTLDIRAEKVVDLVVRWPGHEKPGQSVVWCDLNDEQEELERRLEREGLTISSLYGRDSVEDREALLAAWRNRENEVFLSKPVMYGAGVNLQQAHRMVFAGIGHKFQDFIQAVHRIHRFGQQAECEVHIVYTQAEREIRRSLERKWKQHDEQRAKMAAIIKEYGLSAAAMAQALQRSIGVSREEASGKGWKLVRNDCVLETQTMATDSVDLIVTSIPFSTQYEYSPCYEDFGHTDDSEHFWRQMDFLIPELLRVLKPGRVAAIHVKDRIVPTGLSGVGFQVVQPFSDETVTAFRRHGFGFLARKTVVTDVVRENNQTYRLGWTEQCKDGTKMGAGMPEYVLLFRKPPSDRSNGYADVPVVKTKPLAEDSGIPAPFDKKINWKKPVPGTGYSRSIWQLDAHGFARSSGDRLISSEELEHLIAGGVKREVLHKTLFQIWRDRSRGAVYDFAGHVAVAEDLDRAGLLPATFMLLPPHSWHDDVWTDVARMRTLNGEQHAKGREMHLCPLQFDIVDRLIVQFSMKGETVFDPFAGLGTVPRQALQAGRQGLGCELSRDYWLDSLIYLRAAERETQTLTLFDVLKEAA